MAEHSSMEAVKPPRPEEPPTLSFDHLIREAADGNDDALVILLGRYSTNARRKITRWIPNALRRILSDDDVMQQTYADAFRGIRRFVPHGEGSFVNWLVTLSQCNVRDALRSFDAAKRGSDRRRAVGTGPEESFTSLWDQLSASCGTPSQFAARNEACSMLERAIDSLPLVYRTVIRMYDIDGASIEQVAKTLDRSDGAIYMLRGRAQNQLRDLLGTASLFFSSAA